MNTFTALKKLSPFHFSFLSFFLTYPINTSFHFTLLFTSTTHFPSLHFPSLFIFIAFTSYFLSPSLPPLFYTFLTLVLKIWVLPWEVPISLSGSWFQSVMDLFTKEYFPMSALCFLALIFQWWSTLLTAFAPDIYNKKLHS